MYCGVEQFGWQRCFSLLGTHGRDCSVLLAAWPRLSV
jgi:hypothetical protein